MGEENVVTAGGVSIVVKTLKAGKPAGCDEIRHKILKPSIKKCSLADWCVSRDLVSWKDTHVIFLSLPEEMYATCRETRCLQAIAPKLENTQCSFRPGCSTADQAFKHHKAVPF